MDKQSKCRPVSDGVLETKIKTSTLHRESEIAVEPIQEAGGTLSVAMGIWSSSTKRQQPAKKIERAREDFLSARGAHAEAEAEGSLTKSVSFPLDRANGQAPAPSPAELRVGSSRPMEYQGTRAKGAGSDRVTEAAHLGEFERRLLLAKHKKTPMPAVDTIP